MEAISQQSAQIQSHSPLDIDISELNSCNPTIISRQPTINIGTIGHVSHGKSTVVRAITGVQTTKFNEERLRNITIKLGYANAKIYKCSCEAPECYQSYGSSTADLLVCDKCKMDLKLIRHVSFVDCPGHDILMATMLNGVAVMDAALLLISADQPCPQPQTTEHLAALEIMKLDNIIVLQNKIDIVMKKYNELESHYCDIVKFVQGTKAEHSPIIPISAQLKYNIDVVLEYICRIPIPARDFASDPFMIIIRSFDINTPGDDMKNIKGGVVGGSLIKGVLKIGDEVEIKPGYYTKHGDQIICHVITAKIVSLKAEKNDLLFAIPGGLIGVGLDIDPSLSKSDHLVGCVLGKKGKLPNVYNIIQVKYYLLNKILGLKKTKPYGKVRSIGLDETLLLNVGSISTAGSVLETNEVYINLEHSEA